ncbi:unnamed protein product [Alternaria sp. RS040]
MSHLHAQSPLVYIMGLAETTSTIEVPLIILSFDLHHSAPRSFWIIILWGLQTSTILDDTYSRSSAILYNNPALSDLKIKQIDSGDDEETADSFIELHDDCFHVFEFMLKSTYSEHYGKTAFDKLAANDMIPAGDMTERSLLAINIIHILADKYDVPRLYMAVYEGPKRPLLDPRADWGLVYTIVCRYYDYEPEINTQTGRLIASMFVEPKYVNRIRTDVFETTMLHYPTLAAATLQISRSTYNARSISLRL